MEGVELEDQVRREIEEKIQGGTWEETAKNKCHLRISMEN